MTGTERIRGWLLIPMLACAQAAVAAQGLRALAGTWSGVCADCAPGAMPGGAAMMLSIRVTESSLTMQRDRLPIEVYALDGSETPLPDGRTATATVGDGGVVLTTVRRRARNRDEVFQTIIRHHYRVSGDRLTIERAARAIRPAEPPAGGWAPIGTVEYRRD